MGLVECSLDLRHSLAPSTGAWLESLRAALRRRAGSGSDFSGMEATESVDHVRSMSAGKMQVALRMRATLVCGDERPKRRRCEKGRVGGARLEGQRRYVSISRAELRMIDR